MTRTEMKECPKCKTVKPRTKEFFTIRKHRIDSWCKDCMHKSQREYYHRNKAEIEIKRKSHYLETKSYQREKAKKNYQANKEKKLKQRDIIKTHKIENGICTRCKEKSLPHSNMCEKHHLWNLAFSNLNDGKRWKELQDILVRQNYRDPYTGEELIIGLNAQLDHICPKKRFPDLANDIKNFQFLSKDMNRLKNNFTNDELLNYCFKIIGYLKLERAA